jgi:hypothetical protein
MKKEAGMSFLFLYDPEFLPEVLNCNFSAWNNPTLSAGPDQSELYGLVLQARRGDRAAAAEFADTMHCTLRPAAFENFLRICGPRAIEFRDWFYSKLFQFFEILLHDSIEVLRAGPDGGFGPPKTDRPWEEGVLQGSGPEIHPDDLEEVFSAEDYASYHWLEFVDFAALELAAASSGERFQKVRARIQELRRAAAAKALRGWTDNAKRDDIILGGLKACKSRLQICQMLDEQRIPTTLHMRHHGVLTWIDAWNDKKFRQNVQSLFSHLQERKDVK